jgi:shikimate kinase
MHSRADAPVFLIGFMASGKTTVGRIVAARLGWQFQDLDEIVTTVAGRSVAEIFARDGEPEFRRRESEALRLVCKRERTVVATGGGAACQEQNLSLMLSSGDVVALSVQPAEVVRRAGADSGRPLLDSTAAAGKGDPIAAAAELLATRDGFYARAHHRVDTNGKSPEQVADEVLRLLAVGS